MTEHDYIATACIHDHHEMCRLECKYCATACRCACHIQRDEPAGTQSTTRDWTHEPDARQLGIADPPQFTPADYPEDPPGRDPNCGLTHSHSPTKNCGGWGTA